MPRTVSTIFVGGYAHGRAVNYRTDEGEVKVVEPTSNCAPPMITTKGLSYTDKPVKEHVYLPRKVVRGQKWNDRKVRTVLVHNTLINLNDEALKDILLDALLKAVVDESE